MYVIAQSAATYGVGCVGLCGPPFALVIRLHYNKLPGFGRKMWLESGH
jgi:hypothetical protein